jgi:hypothetical protein
MKTVYAAICVAIALLCLLIGGCVMSAVSGKAPTASAELVPPAGADIESVFGCAERSVAALHRKNQLWNTRISRRDTSAGALETGDFPDDNVGGFRVRVRYPVDTTKIAIEIKAAGPYFSDLGADQALQSFESELGRCLLEKS